MRVGTSPNGSSTACAVIDVTDSGAGIDPTERPFIFNRFYRGAAARERAEGSGLGLSLAQTIVERHGGTISLISQPGQGLTVRITLPAARDITSVT